MQTADQPVNEVRLPSAVRRQVIRTNEIIEAERKRREAGTDPAVTETPPAPMPSEAVAAPPVDPQPTTKPVDPRHNDPRYWEQRFRAVEGIVLKERKLHEAEIEVLHQRVVELEEEVVTLKARPVSPSSSEIDLGKYFTPEQIERIGEDEAMSMAQAAEKAAQAAVDAAVAKVEATLKPERDQRQREQERREAQRYRDFIAALEAEIDDLHELDKNPAWLGWLAESDGNSAFTRQEALDRHMTAQNAPEVIKLVKAFKSETEVKVPAPPIPPSGDTTRTEVPLEQPKPTVKWTQAKIKDYFKRAALGQVTDQERAEFEAWYQPTRRGK